MVPTYIFISKTAFYFYISIFKLIFTLPGRDWAQSGVAQLFTKIKNNGYHIMYLSARAIGQASITKDYLHSVKQVSCDQYFGSALFFMWIRTRAKIVMRIRIRVGQTHADPDSKHCFDESHTLEENLSF